MIFFICFSSQDGITGLWIQFFVCHTRTILWHVFWSAHRQCLRRRSSRSSASMMWTNYGIPSTNAWLMFSTKSRKWVFQDCGIRRHPIIGKAVVARLVDGMIDWSIDFWLIDRSIFDWLIDWSIDWLIDWSIDWLIDPCISVCLGKTIVSKFKFYVYGNHIGAFIF